MHKRHLLNHIPEVVTFVVFAVSLCVVSAFHEPWFDEAQAWQIAKCASYHDILFEIPHYEGHPPLWHLILSVPAKLGVPFELGLKCVGITITLASAWLILFKSPFPLPARLALPFGYFVFYQYGVIVRPYALMLLAFLLLAWQFPQRLSRPWRYIGLLVLLCLTSAYGMLFACGIALCMTAEIVQEKGIARMLRELVSDQRTLALLALLLAAVLMVLQIMPRPDTWATSGERVNSLPVLLACALLVFPAECTLTTSAWMSMDRVLLQGATIEPMALVFSLFVGIVLWALVLCFAPKSKIAYLVVPYALFALFAACVYFSVHHVGIAWLFLLFWLWVAVADKSHFEVGQALLAKLAQTERDKRLARITFTGICALCLAIPVLWNARSMWGELTSEYYFGRSIASFLQSTHLDDALILCNWEEHSAPPHAAEPYVDGGILMSGAHVCICPYFNRNIFYCLNEGSDTKAYFLYRLQTREEIARTKKQWAQYGAPDVLIGAPNLSDLFGDAVSLSDYTLVKVCDYTTQWKGNAHASSALVYVRDDLIDTYDLEPVEDPSIQFLTEGLQITDEMREQYESGVPMEEVLAPYLDQVF